MGLNKQEVLVIAETNRGNYSVVIRSSLAGLWQVEIKIGNPDLFYEVFTSRGDLKTWKNLSDAVKFVQENCADCKDVKIEINNWVFERRS